MVTDHFAHCNPATGHRTAAPVVHCAPVTEIAQSLDVSGFDRVDEANSPDAFAAWMAHQRRHGPDGRIDLLELDASSRALDLGCGTGTDLSRLVEVAAHVVGVDRSSTMLETIRRGPSGSQCELVNADGVDLPFRDDTFDATWVRAVLIHTPAPEQALAEIARVTRPGGRIVLSEPDHGSHVVACSCPEVFERIKAHRRQRFQNPLIGRGLADLAARAGLAVTNAWAAPILHRSMANAFAAGGPFGVAVQAAVEDGAITEDEASYYESSLAELDARGAFFFAGLAVTISAVVPSR